MILCRMPEERIKWKDVVKGFAAIARSYGAKNARQAILALSGEDDISDAVIDDLSTERLPRFELWKWEPSSKTFVLVRHAIGTPSAT